MIGAGARRERDLVTSIRATSSTNHAPDLSHNRIATDRSRLITSHTLPRLDVTSKIVDVTSHAKKHTHHLYEILAVTLLVCLLEYCLQQQFVLGQPLHGRYYEVLQLESFALRLRFGPLQENTNQ